MPQSPFPGIKVFIDTSVLIAGLASVSGASATILDLGEARIVQLVISRQVLIEADRNLTAKLPKLVNRFRSFLRHLSPVLVDDPSSTEIEAAASVIHLKDAPILAAAKKAQVDYLITLDKRHFLSGRIGKRGWIKIVTPGEFLQVFERLYLERSEQD
jgi:predicted nucleic acid-binding protein